MDRNTVWYTILGPLLLYIANYADDTTTYSAAETQECVIEKLEDSLMFFFKWFSRNCMKVNSSNSHLVMPGKRKVIAKVDNNETKSQNPDELLGSHIDFTLNLENYIDKICKKASQNLNTVAKLSPYIRRTIMMWELDLI